ncbi:MAG: SDR family NAD(P)-dependent oxidoreductase [Bacteroidia bacterium]
MGLRYFFISGTSRGLGRALANVLLAQEDVRVWGFSRGAGPAHPNYTHFPVDLGNSEAVNSIVFPELTDASQLVLINNAGAISPVARAGTQEANAIEKLIFLNLTAPIILTNAFLKKYAQNNTPKLIVHISSGAGRRGIDAWNVYCATKAGLDNHARAVAEELLATQKNDTYIFSVAPGIIDTAMQTEIRTTTQDQFSLADQFKLYHETNQLASPDLVAKKFLTIFNHPEKATGPVFSINDIP